MCKNVRGFTLLESLIALLVISGSILVYNALTSSVVSHVTYLSQSDQRNWLLFSQQFWSELEGSRLVKVENNRLQIEKNDKELSFGQYRSDDFRKTDISGRGYQPMLYGIKSSQIVEDNGCISLKLVFKSGLQRTFLYDFKEKS